MGVEAFAETGVTRLLVSFDQVETVSELREQLDRFAAEVIAVRKTADGT